MFAMRAPHSNPLDRGVCATEVEEFVMAAPAACPAAARPEESLAFEARLIRLAAHRKPAPKPAARDWSNVVFSVAFCEEARRAWEARAAS